MLQTLNRMSQLYKLLFFLLLVSSSSVNGDIGCYCDSQSCQDLGATECRAEFYCYVSFRAAQHGNRTQQQQHRSSVETLAAASLFDSSLPEDGGVWASTKPRPTKQYYEAVNRGCVASSQLDICIGTAHDEGENGLLIRCCKDSWCNTGRTLEIAHAESPDQSKHVSVSSRPSSFGEDPLYNALPRTPQRFPFSKAVPEGVQSGQPFRKREDLPAGPRSPLRPITSKMSNQMKSIWDLPTPASSTQTSALSLSDTAKPSVSEEATGSYSIVLQPLHIAIGVCLVILMVVAILLHVLIVLQRRHRRLKRELRQTQKSGLRQESGNQQSPIWLHHQRPGGPQHTSLAILNGTRILAHFDVHGMPDEHAGDQPTQLGLQQMQYTESSGDPYAPVPHSVFAKQAPMKSSGCAEFCLWCRRKQSNQTSYDAEFYDEVIPRNSTAVAQERTRSILQDRLPLPATSKSSLEKNAYTPFLDTKKIQRLL
uniref:Uncharacterized protein n=1 Tax=Schistocephalus solidus TaxID=70667 RepID=A0A0V0J8W6_SCHSO